MPPVEQARGRAISICSSWHVVAPRPFCYSSPWPWRFPRLAAQKRTKSWHLTQKCLEAIFWHISDASTHRSRALELILRWQLMLASVLMLAENGPSPFTLGGVSPEKVFFKAGKLLSVAFSGSRLEAPRKSTGVDSLWLDSGWHPRCLMTTGYYAYIGSSSWAWCQDG